MTAPDTIKGGSAVPDTEIVLAQHGDAWTGSQNNAAARPGFRQGLSGDGARQARLLAAALARQSQQSGVFDALYTCPSLYCLETATVISDALGIPLSVVAALRTPDAEMLTRTGALIPAPRRTEPADWWEAYAGRAGTFLTGVPQAHPGARVLIVGHASTQRAALTAFLRLPPRSGWWAAPLEHGAICRWTHTSDSEDLAGCWALTAHNDVEHLHQPDVRPVVPQLADIRRQRGGS